MFILNLVVLEFKGRKVCILKCLDDEVKPKIAWDSYKST